MKNTCIFAVLTFFSFAEAQQPLRIVDLKGADGALLKASYFAAAKPARACCCSIKAIVTANPGTAWPNNWRRLA